MALQARFEADFSAFKNAVDQAEVQLKSFDAGAGKVSTSLTRMSNSLSGTKMIQDATLMAKAVENVGGVSALTERELQRVAQQAQQAAEKLRALGQDVPPGIQKIADKFKEVGVAGRAAQSVVEDLKNELVGVFTVGAITAFGRKVLEAGDIIQKMADQTGLSIEQVQRLQYIAGQSGSSIESLVGAVQNLQQRLGDENSGAAGAMRKLGINADAFGKLNTYAQMTSLAEAVRGVHDPTEQASLAAALFGKTWKEILPAIKAGMEDVGKAATVMGDDTVHQLDAIGDALKASEQTAVAWGGNVVLWINKAGYAFGNMLSAFNPEHFGRMTSMMLQAEGALNDPNGLKGAFSSIKAPAVAAANAIEQVGMSSAKAADLEKTLTESAKASIEVHKQQAEAVKKVAEAQERFRNSVERLSFKTFVTDGLPMVGLMTDLSVRSGQFRDGLLDLDSAINEVHTGLSITGQELKSVTIPAFAALATGAVPQGTAAIKEATAATKTLGETLRTDLLTTLQQIPDLVVSAFTGGGGLTGALKGIGSLVGSKIGKDIGESIKSLASFGGPIGSAIGSLVGPLLGAITGIGGPSKNELAARSAAGSFQSQFGSFQQLMDAVGDAYTKTGHGADAARQAVQRLLDATHQSAEAVQAALTPINAVMDAAKAKATLTATSVQQIVSAGQSLGTTLPPALKTLIDQLAHMQGLTDQERDSLLGLTSAVKPNFEALEGVAASYGVTLSGLGSKFEQAHLEGQAKKIYDDFDALRSAGADVGGVLFGMRTQIGNLVADSQKFGTAIPDNIRPLIENLIQTGQLTDEAGQQFTDLTAISFEDTPVDAGVAGLTEKVTSLIQSITGDAGAVSAINAVSEAVLAIPNKTIHVGWTVDPFPDVTLPEGFSTGSNGGLVTSAGIQAFAGGGRVLPFSRGTDTVPAMLTPGEVVLTKDQQQRLASGQAAPVIDLAGVRADLQALRADNARRDAQFAVTLAKAVRDEVQKVQVRR